MAAAKVKKLVIPKNLGAQADLYDTIREERLEIESRAEELKKQETQIKEHLIEALKKAKMTGAAGSRVRADIDKKEYPTVTDIKKLYAHIKKTGEFDLLNRAVNAKAVKERWEAKKTIPGVGKFTKSTLSITRIKGKKQ